MSYLSSALTRVCGAALAAAVLAGALAGCGSATTASEVPAGTFIANSSEPDNPLIPADSTGNDGIDIIDNLFAGLVYVDADGKVRPEAARSITSQDNRTWTIELEPGRTFSDGTKVTATSFVKAWTTSARAGLKAIYPYAVIEGAGDDGRGTLTGLKVLTDTSFTVTLKEPIASFPDRLVQNAFYPLPEAAYDSSGSIARDFGEHPIGNGPYQLDGDKAWVHKQKIALKASATYKGPREPKNKGVTLKFYTEADAAYTDLLSGSLDVLDEIPATALATFRDDLGGRAISSPVAANVGIDIDAAQAKRIGYDAEGRLRRLALSRALDREKIVSTIYSSTQAAATDFLPPMIPGHADSGIPGQEAMVFDAKAAKEAWDKANAIHPWEGTLRIMYAADGGSRDLIEAVAHQWHNVLGIDAQANPVPDFPTQMTAMRDHTVTTGAFKLEWSMGYPAADNIFSGRFLPGGGGHYHSYNSPAFAAAVAKARAAAPGDVVAANRAAQAILFADLPSIPLYSENVTGGWSERVSNVKFGWNGNPLYYAVKVSS